MGGRGSGSKPVEVALAVGLDPWERQPGESAKAWSAFVEYRKLGAERAIRKVVQSVGQKARYVSVLEKWSARWGWVMRAGAWDAYADRCEREAVLEVAEQKARDKLSVADEMWQTAALGLVMWSEYLIHVRQEQIAAGAPAEPPISPADVHRLADAGLKLSQLLEGKPTDIQEQRAQITIEERRKGIQQLIGNPRLRAAMRQVVEAREAALNPDAKGNGDAGAVH